MEYGEVWNYKFERDRYTHRGRERERERFKRECVEYCCYNFIGLGGIENQKRA